MQKKECFYSTSLCLRKLYAFYFLNPVSSDTGTASVTRTTEIRHELLKASPVSGVLGPNCFAGSRVIPAGERVDIDEQTACYCTYRDGTWNTHPHATCEQRSQPSPTLSTSTDPPRDEDTGGRLFPRLDLIP